MTSAIRSSLVAALASVIALIVVSVTAATSAQPYVSTCLRSSLVPGCPGHVEFDTGGAVLPKKLPAHELAPIGLEIHGTIAMEGGGHPVALHEVIIDVTKNVSIDATGLPACEPRLLESRGVAVLRRLCGKAIVGTGVAHVGLASSETTLKAPLTLFNGGTYGGEAKLFVHSAIGAPNPVPVVSRGTIKRMYSGLHTVWRIPRILDGDGSLLDFKLKVERRFVSKGTEHSYLAAKCPNGVFRVNAPSTLFRNDARIPGVESAMSLKGAFAIPCSPVP
jgi:hypothetical protein